MNFTLLESIIQAGGPNPEEYLHIDRMLALLSEIPTDDRPAIVERLRSMLAPTLTLDTMQGFAFLKPHGYAGDFEIIDRIYQEWKSPSPDFEKWDHYFHSQDAPIAVRNRKAYFINTVRALGSEPKSVLNIASGPGRDLLECLEQTATEHCFTCLDIETKALDHSKELCAEYSDRIEFIEGNALKFSSNEQFDLIWSGGLFDYFTDRVFIIALKRLLRLVTCGGELVVGNFSEINPSRTYMELVGDWNLIHRTPKQLIDLAVKAGVKSHLIEVKEENLGVNLFLHIEKD